MMSKLLEVNWLRIHFCLCGDDSLTGVMATELFLSIDGLMKSEDETGANQSDCNLFGLTFGCHNLIS